MLTRHERISKDRLSELRLRGEGVYQVRCHHSCVQVAGLLGSGLTPAERLLEKFHGEWQGDISRVFEDCAY